MGCVGLGLAIIVAAILLMSSSDTPTTWSPIELTGVVVLLVGVAAMLVGMMVHVVQVERSDPGSPSALGGRGA